jgi:hypothetical protein
MRNHISKTQTARLLVAFIRFADDKGSIDPKNQAFFEEIGKLFTNANILDQHLYELNAAGSIEYEEIGEDGFTPIIFAGCTEKTSVHLATILEEIENDLISTKNQINEILTFDPDRLRSEISEAESQLKAARKSAEENELLKPLLRHIEEIEKEFQGVSAVADRYEDVYKNIIRPVQLEGQSGVKATVRWSIIRIIESTAISVILGRWKELGELLKKLF